MGESNATATVPFFRGPLRGSERILSQRVGRGSDDADALQGKPGACHGAAWCREQDHKAGLPWQRPSEAMMIVSPMRIAECSQGFSLSLSVSNEAEADRVFA